MASNSTFGCFNTMCRKMLSLRCTWRVTSVRPLAGIVKYEEVAAGAINHAIRVSVRQTDAGFIPPASHFAPVGSGADRPPMGLRLRLRADFDRSRFTGQARIVADALAKYGAIVADNGFNWIFFGAPNPGWDTDNLSQLWQVPGTAFEAVDTGPVLR